MTPVAHSFGTVIAAHYAATYPGEVRRVVLLGTPVWGSESEARERIKSMSTLGWTFLANRPLAIATCTVMCAVRPALRRILSALDRSRPPEVVRDSVLHDLGSVDGAVGIMLHHPIAKPVQLIGPNFIFVHGRQDPVTPLETVEILARASGAELIVVDADHHDYLTRALRRSRAPSPRIELLQTRIGYHTSKVDLGPESPLGWKKSSEDPIREALLTPAGESGLRRDDRDRREALPSPVR